LANTLTRVEVRLSTWTLPNIYKTYSNILVKSSDGGSVGERWWENLEIFAKSWLAV